MRFDFLASPRRVKRGIEYLLQCWKARASVRHWLDQGPTINHFLEERPFLHRCLGERSFVEQSLNHRPAIEHWFRERSFLDHCFQEQAFLNRCLTEKNLLCFYLDTRKELQSFNIEEGTVLFPQEHRFLEQLVETANTLPGPIVEIGTLFGFTTSRFAVWKSTGKKIITVDNYSWNPWGLAPAIHRQLTRQFLDYLVETGQVELVDMDKNAFYESYQGEPPALVFFDSIHDYETTRDDIAWARRVGAKVIAGHDYHEDFPGVMKAVAEAGGLGARAGVVWALQSEFTKSLRTAA